jgi:predicted DNA binding CopG/RHH family protein
MTEPGTEATDAELADYYDRHRDLTTWGEPEPKRAAGRLDVTISVRFSADELAAVRARAEAAGLKPTTYIRRLVLTADEAPLDRTRLARTVDALTRDLDDLRRMAG